MKLISALIFTVASIVVAGPAIAKPVTLPVSGVVHWEGTGIGKAHPGTLNLKSGEVKLNGKDIVGGEFTIDMKSLTTPDGKRLENHLKSADFFEVTKFPEAKFVITKSETLKKKGPKGETHKITGNLTIRDKTHPVTFMAQISKKDSEFKAVANTTIEDRTQFDIKYNSGRVFDFAALGDKLIHDEIKIRLNLTAKRE